MESTSPTPEMAASPAEETMRESSMPSATASVWLMISGITIFISSRLENIIFLISLVSDIVASLNIAPKNPQY